MKKQTKILIILIILIILLVAILLLRNLLEKKQEENKQYNSIEDFKNPKEVVEYLQSKYIGEEKSVSEGFTTDIYVNFKVDLYTNEASNEEYYNKMMDMISYTLNYNSFRLIDDEKQMLIAVVCDSENGRIKRKYINGDSNYFGNIESNKNLQKMEEIKMTPMEIQSPEVLKLINNNWKSTNINFGTKTETFEKYDIYENEGIQVRNVYKKVFNIVFKENYKKPVINGITTSMTEEQIKEILGKPTIESEDMQIIGYKGKDIYVFFSQNRISIYRVEYYDTLEFVEIVKKYIEDKDVKKFVSNITDIWPDYDKYEYGSEYVNLEYALKGIKIRFNVTKNHGVIIYNNCDKAIFSEMDNKKLKNNVFYENKNAILLNEEGQIRYEGSAW